MVLGGLCAIIDHPEDMIPLARLKMTAARLGKEIPPEPHWAFSYGMLYKVSRSFSLVIHQLPTELRDPICIFYLILRALDTVEDDTSISSDVKVPILQSFHQHIYDKNWHFSCGTKDYKVLMDKLHLVSTAFLELDKSFQEVIEDTTKRMGEGMAKFICQEVETLKDYDEYCYYVAGLVGEGVTKLTHSCGLEDLTSVRGTISMGLFLQKTNIIRDYLEDINEIPKSRMFWPREIWSKYANKLEDFKYEENSMKAVECLNELITNALMHVEGCLQYMSQLRNPSIIHSFAIPQIMAIGTLALCYNNIEVFRGVVKMRRGLTAQIFDQTRSVSDIYSAFFDFSSMLKDKVEMNDPNAELTLKCIENIQNACINSGMLMKRRYDGGGSRRFLLVLVTFLLALIFVLIASFMKKGTVPYG